MIPFPDKKYDIIYADPPWAYERRMKGANHKVWDQGAHLHYPTMSMEELSELPIHDIINKDCLLFLWVISPKMPDCIKVEESWGFKYITIAFVWHKNAPPVAGNYTMSSCEICLVFKHGKIPQPRGKRNVQQLLEEPEFLKIKRGKHSVKPKQIKERITQMFPIQSKIELFARPDWTDYGRGWDFWGNEV